MATKNAVEVKSLDELNKDLEVKQKELVDAKYSHAAGELTNPKVLKELRKAVARLKTQINSNKEVK